MPGSASSTSTQVGVHEANTRLSKLLRNGRLAARLVPPPTSATRVFGADREQFEVPADFDAPLSDDVLDAFHS